MITVFDNPETMCRELLEDGEILFIVISEMLGSGPKRIESRPPSTADELIAAGAWEAGKRWCWDFPRDWVWEGEVEE